MFAGERVRMAVAERGAVTLREQDSPRPRPGIVISLAVAGRASPQCRPSANRCHSALDAPPKGQHQHVVQHDKDKIERVEAETVRPTR
jgi:hypothetical protein